MSDRCAQCDASRPRTGQFCAECGCDFSTLGGEFASEFEETLLLRENDDDDATEDDASAGNDDDVFDPDLGDAPAAIKRQVPGRSGEFESLSTSSDSDDSTKHEKRLLIQRERDLERSPEMLKLLYMIYLYTSDSASSTPRKACAWMRQLPLLVLIYEGVVREVFDYDYAPQAENVYGGVRMYLNISEDGRDDLDDLRELKMLKALKVTSEQYDHSTLLKITSKGVEFIKRMQSNNLLTAAMRKMVESLIFEAGMLIEVRFDKVAKSFSLTVPQLGFSIPSTITDIEEVPYVSSPYIMPSMLANAKFTPDVKGGNAMAQRMLAERGRGRSSRDKHVVQYLALDDVKLFITEWVPMGSNELSSFCSKLGTGERVPGGMFCERAADDDEFDMVIAVSSEHKTRITVLDMDETAYVNVEAELLQSSNLGKDRAKQIEHFGINFVESGIITYGLYVNGIADRVRKNISLDLLARLLADVYEDTSFLVSNLFSNYQRSMLEIAFKMDSDNRPKFVCVMAERITPKLKAENYMDGENNENELKQVIGATFNAYDLSDDEVIVFGTHGVIIFGPNTSRHHRLLSVYCELQARSSFVKSVFSSCFALADDMRHTRALVDDYQSDPTSIFRIRERLSAHTGSVSTLYEIQQFLLESLENMDTHESKLLPAKRGHDATGKKLFDLMQLEDSLKRMKRRVIDLQKVVSSCFNDLEALRELSGAIGATRKLQINQMIEGTTKNLEDAFRAQSRNSTTLEVTQVILSGSLAFDILDRLTGQYLSYTGIRWSNEHMQPYLVNVPLVWFILNMCTWTIIGGSVLLLMRHLAYMNLSVETKKLLLNKPINVKRWKRFVATRTMESVSLQEETSERISKYNWTEPDDIKWKGSAPNIEVTCEERYGYVLSSVVLVNKRTCKLTADECWRIFWRDVFEIRNICDDSRALVDEETGKRVKSTELSDDEDEGNVEKSDKGAKTELEKSPSTWSSLGRKPSLSVAKSRGANDEGSDLDELVAEDYTLETFIAERKASMKM